LSKTEEPKVVATGVSGTIGRQLARSATSVSFSEFCQNLKLPNQIDLTDSIVVHLAGVVGARAVDQNPEAAREVNVFKTLEFAKLCIAEGAKRFIYVSSAHVYKSSNSPINERASLEPSSEYAAQKLEAEESLRKLASEYPLDLVCLRLFSVLSLDGKPDTLGARVARAMENKTRVSIPFAADCRDFLSPRVYAQVIMKIAAIDHLGHGIVNIGSGKALSVEAAVRRLLKSNYSEDLKIEFDPRFSTIPHLVADNLLLRQILGAEAAQLDFP